MACICIKLKQIQLITTKNTPSSSERVNLREPCFFKVCGDFEIDGGYDLDTKIFDFRRNLRVFFTMKLINYYFFYNSLPMFSWRLKSAGGYAPDLTVHILLSAVLPGRRCG